MSCEAKTKRGLRCRRPALQGAKLCHGHAGEGVGRHPKLTEELARRILEALRVGNSLEVAAHHAGISRSTLQRWLSLGREEEAEPRYRSFAEQVRRARADAEYYAVAVLRRAMSEDWRAALAYLERAHPRRWARRAAAARPNGSARAERSEADIDTTDPETRRLLSEALRARATDR